MVLSELPLTTSRSWYWRHAMPRLCPFSVRTNSHVEVCQTLMVRSPDAETMYFWSKSTTLTAARWPTRTRRRLMSVADCMSHTAIDRSWRCKTKHVLDDFLRAMKTGNRITRCFRKITISASPNNFIKRISAELISTVRFEKAQQLQSCNIHTLDHWSSI